MKKWIVAICLLIPSLVFAATMDPTTPSDNESIGLGASHIRIIKSYISDFGVDVKDARYGAKGDGITDDTAAINSARAAAIAAGSPLLFPPGTYAIDQFTGWPNGTVYAYGATILHNGASKPLLNLYDSTPTTITNFHWYGGTLKAKQSATNPTSALIYGRNLTRSTIADVILQGGTADDSTKYAVKGIHLDGTAGAGNGVYEVNITNAVVRGCSGNGVDLDGWDGATSRVNNNTFINPLVLNNGGNGFQHDGQGTAIHGGNVEGNTGVGHYLADHGTYYAIGGWAERNTAGNFDVSGTGAMPNYSVYIGASGTTPSTTIRAYYLAWIARTASFGFGIDVQHGTVDAYRSAAGSRAFGAFVDGDTQPRINVTPGGIFLGPGGATVPAALLQYIGTQTVDGTTRYQWGGSANTIRYLNDGTWNKEHWQLGSWHIWLNTASGKLYIKNGTPSNATDGTIIGPP